jgi:hypothetical protein
VPEDNPDEGRIIDAVIAPGRRADARWTRPIVGRDRIGDPNKLGACLICYATPCILLADKTGPHEPVQSRVGVFVGV